MKESFVFYLKWADQVDKLTVSQKAEFLNGVFAYARGDDFETDDLAVDILVDLVTEQMDRDSKKYEAKVERMAKARSKNPNNNQTNISQKSDSNQTNISSDNVNENVNVNDNVNDNENVNVNDNGGGGGNDNVSSDNSAAASPCPEEIKNYFEEIGSSADPERFMNYYGLGALSHMDWKAKANEWKKTQYIRKETEPDWMKELREWAKE